MLLKISNFLVFVINKLAVQLLHTQRKMML